MSVPQAGTPRLSKLKVLVALSFAAVCMIWGSTWIAIRIAVADMPPLTAAGLRFVVAAPVFLVAARAMGTPLRYPRKLNWFFAFILICYFTVPFYLLNVGEQYVSSGLAAICMSSVSILMIVFSVPILRTRITRTQFTAALVAFLALGVLIIHAQGVALSSVWGVAAVLSAAVIHALAYIMIKRHGSEMHTLTLNTIPMAVAGVALTGLGLLVEQPGADAFTARSIGATLYLGIVASVVGFAVYFWLVQRMNTVTVSFAFVLFPIIAQFLAFTVEGVGFDWIGMLLTLVVLGAFAVTQWNQRVVARGIRSTVDADGRPTEAALAEIYRHVLASYPAEACGFVRASGVRPCANVIDDLSRDRPADFDRVSRNGYAFGPTDIQYLEQSFDGDDPVLIIYHSHPDAGAYFSDEDARYAMFDGMPLYPVRHLVVDTGQDRVHGSRLFGFDDDRYVAVAEFGQPRDQILPSGSLE